MVSLLYLRVMCVGFSGIYLLQILNNLDGQGISPCEGATYNSVGLHFKNLLFGSYMLFLMAERGSYSSAQLNK